MFAFILSCIVIVSSVQQLAAAQTAYGEKLQAVVDGHTALLRQTTEACVYVVSLVVHPHTLFSVHGIANQWLLFVLFDVAVYRTNC